MLHFKAYHLKGFVSMKNPPNGGFVLIVNLIFTYLASFLVVVFLAVRADFVLGAAFLAGFA